MDKGRTAADKKLAEMEKKLAGIYKRADKEIGQKWKEYMEQVEAKSTSLYEAVKAAKTAEERRNAEERYKTHLQNSTFRNEHFRALTQQYAHELTEVNRTAVKYVNDQMADIYVANYNSIGNEVKGKVKGYSFELADAGTVKKLATEDKTLLPYKIVNGRKDERWNTKAVNSEVLQGILQGESVPNIAKRLRSVTEMNLASSVRNARTSTTSAENRGRMDSFHQAQEKGVRIVKVWMATNDGRTREAHIELDGQEREIDEPFENELGEIMYPGDPNADPANVYNCRCTMITRVLGFSLGDVETQDDDWQDGEFKGDMPLEVLGERQTFTGETVKITQFDNDWRALYDIDYQDDNGHIVKELALKRYDAEKEFYKKYQIGQADEETFFYNTSATFTQEKRRPKREPDYVSYNKRTGKVSSEYWYTDEGVIRGSDHWGEGVASCDWYLGEQTPYTFTTGGKKYGSCNWEDFQYKSKTATIDGDKYLLGFDNSTKNDITINGKTYVYNKYNYAWEEIGE